MRIPARAPLHLSIFVSIALYCFPAYSQSLNGKWKRDLNNAIEQFLKCQASGDTKNSCTEFLGKSLNTVYGVNDFYSTTLSRYMTASEISEFLKKNNTWTLLGPCYEQSTLSTAQEYANHSKAVVAVYMDPADLGHVALILPGDLSVSGSWGLRVPNAASFLLSEPEKSFIDKGLSYAFKKSMLKNTMVYVRKY